MKFRMLVFAFIAIFSVPATYAASNSEEISKCLSDSTTGKDRKDLARWIFSGMAQHPEVKALAKVSVADREKIEKSAGVLYNRLLTQDCIVPVKVALKAGDQAALNSAFESLGKLAMAELMSNPNVTAAFGGVGKYIDNTKFESLRN